MAHSNYALVKDGNVLNVIVFDDPTEELLNQIKISENVDMIIPASNFAVINGTYDGSKFWAPQPYPSWIKNEETNLWEPPIQYPVTEEGGPLVRYSWNEDILNWEEILE